MTTISCVCNSFKRDLCDKRAVVVGAVGCYSNKDLNDDLLFVYSLKNGTTRYLRQRERCSLPYFLGIADVVILNPLMLVTIFLFQVSGSFIFCQFHLGFYQELTFEELLKTG